MPNGKCSPFKIYKHCFQNAWQDIKDASCSLLDEPSFKNKIKLDGL